jgi:flagellar basal-body rod protein FlgG
MNRTLSIARTGMDAQQLSLDTISNNLANTGTNGFKASRTIFQDLIYQTIRQPGGPSSSQTVLPTGLQVGTGVIPVSNERLQTQGNLSSTGNSLDVAISGQGFFSLLMPDGTTGYTRDGSFTQNAAGQLVSVNGYVVQPAITIPTGATAITIAQDGTVSYQSGTTSTQIGVLSIATFPNPGGLASQGGSLFTETVASGAPTTTTPGQNGAGVLQAGYIETANVNVVQELVNMIQAQRTYEMNSKAITTADQMLQRITQM